jgi:hypothetical protein
VIGVRANPGEEDVVREFFELFKTPWEFSRDDRRYEVLLSTTAEPVRKGAARLVVVFSGEQTPFDDEAGAAIGAWHANLVLSYGTNRIPIYGRAVTFRGPGLGLVVESHPRQSAACVIGVEGPVVVRVGYDLFREVRMLLSEGQPPANAGIPTLELHISLLRELICWFAGPLVEIPPLPKGHRFIACLTHDVDHPSVRHHRWDRTMLGFLYRACVGSVINVCRGRASGRDLLTNWAAAARLPLVHLGLAKDFWCELHRYLAMEPGAASTFFVIPAKDYPGQTHEGQAPSHRAARYGARDIADELGRLRSAGCEIGLHGIDAWLDSARGRQELEEIARVAEARDIGVRMHWLYSSEKSPAILEQAGFAYDASSGYNETVGYRAGTTQVFKPLGVTALLELPLHVMDTALFYPAHLHLTPRDARDRVRGIIDNAVRFGGTVTLNWHDRSIASERLWGRVYTEILDDLREAGAWFPTASQAVAWFRKRREATFDAATWNPDTMRVRVSVAGGQGLPGLRLRIHKAREAHERASIGAGGSGSYVDLDLSDNIDTCIPA